MLKRAPGNGIEESMHGAQVALDIRHGTDGTCVLRSILLTLLTAGTTWLCAGAAHAQYAAQLYPYCSISSSSGATSCYVASRDQCGGSCIRNPWYLGARRAAPYLQGRRELEPHYVQP